MNEQSPPKKLTRSRTDRYVGGVAAGLAERFNVDPVFVRLAFAASLVFGGLGLLVYIGLLVLTPVEGDPSEPVPPLEPRRRTMMIGLSVAVALIFFITADSGGTANWLFGFWPGTVFGVLFWVAAAVAAIWLFASGTLSFNQSSETGDAVPPVPAATKPVTTDAPPPEVVTYAEAPTQLSRTEVMETRQMNPPKETPVSPKSRDTDRRFREGAPSTFGRIMVWLAVGVTVLFLTSILFVVSAGTTAIFGGVPMAALVILLGAGMVFAGLRGRRQISLWLLAAAVAVTLPMAAVSIADLRVDGSYGDIRETPLTKADIPSDGYRMAAGNTTIDLRKFDFRQLSPHRALDLKVKSGMGLTSIVVPDSLCMTGEVSGKAGVVYLRGRQANGIDVSLSGADLGVLPHPRHEPTRVNLDAEFKLGAFEVVDSTQWRRDGRGGSFDESNDPENIAARKRAAAACVAVPSKHGHHKGTKAAA